MKRFGRPLQFSLATALLGVCFAGAVMAVCINKDPWYVRRTIESPNNVCTFAISDDEKILALATDESALDETKHGRVMLKDFASGEVCCQLSVHSRVNELEFNGKRKLLRTFDDGAVTRIWKATNGEELTNHKEARGYSSKFVGDDYILLWGHGCHGLWYYDFSTTGLDYPYEPEAGYQFANLSPDGKMILSTNHFGIPCDPFEAGAANFEPGILTLLNSATLVTLRRVHVSSVHKRFLVGILIPGNNTIVAATEGGELLRIDAESGAIYWRTPLTLCEFPRLTAFPTGSRLAISEKESVKIFDTNTGVLLTTIKRTCGDLEMLPPLHILRNGDIVTLSGGKIVVFSRRFPEWWLGHFYRVETWLAIAFGIVLAWRFGRWVFQKPRSIA